MLSEGIQSSSLESFGKRLIGTLVLPDDPDYDTVRQLWNGMIEKRPALIVRCANHADVITAVQYARSQNLEIAVRGGRHSVSGLGSCDGGMQIDLSPMKGIAIDPVKQTAWAQAGLTLGEFMNATAEYGLATTTGIISHTGMSGLTLGGGVGWLGGKYGLAVDNLISVEVVTADGQFLSASERENADLFWGICGGGGNFGIVTTFEFQLHPVKQVLAGPIGWPISKAREVLRFYRDFTSSVPDELTVYASLQFAPTVGAFVVAMVACYCGDLEEGQRVLAPLRAFADPIADHIAPVEYTQLLTMLDESAEPGGHAYEKTSSIANLSDEAIDTVIEHFQKSTSPFSFVLFQHIHGAATRVDPSATATFAVRQKQYLQEIIAGWRDNQPDKHIAWTRNLWSAMLPFSQQGTYINMLDDGDDRLRASYGPNYERLVALKNKYDPDNVFHLNPNIKPTS
jgi:hypothetical protein